MDICTQLVAGTMLQTYLPLPKTDVYPVISDTVRIPVDLTIRRLWEAATWRDMDVPIGSWLMGMGEGWREPRDPVGYVWMPRSEGVDILPSPPGLYGLDLMDIPEVDLT